MGDVLSHKSISVIIPSFHCRNILLITLKSLKKFCPNDIILNYIVVENSDDVSYKQEVIDLIPNITWINNKTEAIGSYANAEGITIGLQYVHDSLVFMFHCDICVTNSNFFKDFLQKYKDGYRLIGACYDMHPDRIKAVHILGLLTETELARKVNYNPHYENNRQIMDVGDELTQYCRNNDIKYFCFKNTYNDLDIVNKLNDKYRQFDVVRCIDDDYNTIFMHLARGVAKTNGTYGKANKVGVIEWVNFCNEIME